VAVPCREMLAGPGYKIAQELETQSGAMPTRRDDDLNGPSANLGYYQVPLLGQATRLDVTDKVERTQHNKRLSPPEDIDEESPAQASSIQSSYRMRTGRFS
jgi:hypothetical protein